LTPASLRHTYRRGAGRCQDFGSHRTVAVTTLASPHRERRLQRCRRHRTTIPDPSAPRSPELVQRGFTSTGRTGSESPTSLNGAASPAVSVRQRRAPRKKWKWRRGWRPLRRGWCRASAGRTEPLIGAAAGHASPRRSGRRVGGTGVSIRSVRRRGGRTSTRSTRM
jgi:hypothetical protein